MTKLGVTGGIGSGKSTVCKLFTLLGIPVFDADARAKTITEENPDIIKSIKKLFGHEIYMRGKPDREMMARAVFNDPGKLKALNDIVHPAVKKAFRQWARQHKNAPYLVHEAAILIESGAHQEMDLNLLVYAPREVRAKRVMERDRRSKEQIEKIMGKQMGEREKQKYCSYTVANDGKQAIIPQVLAIDKELKKRGRA